MVCAWWGTGEGRKPPHPLTTREKHDWRKRMKYYIPSTSWIPDYSFTLYVSFPAFYSTPSNVGLFQNINNTNITNTNNKRDRSRLGGDVLAGMTVACMLIPQSVSYASSLAKLSPVSGLVRPFFLPLLGSNPHHSAKKKKK